ncbi:LysR family transcriptional regulator [Dokdonella soli]|uniref:LysR family transcriptional regulator n=1 Tax=Dokdonella soli TaxID=529810 RepID=A0ABP3TJJ6_9GAMM
MKPSFTITPDQLPALLAFARVAAHGSFTSAARELEVSPSALSQTIRGLETRLGVRLLNRTTRRVGLTEAGAALLTRVEPALSEIDTAIGDLRQQRERPAGTLRITAPQVGVPALLEPHLADFLAAYPDICLDIHVDSSLNDLVTQGLDAGIRLGEKVQRDMVALPLGGAQRSVVVGAPAYFAQCGTPQHPRELQSHNCLRSRFSLGGATYRWEFCERGRWFEIGVEGSVICNDHSLLLRAATHGVGLVHTMEPLVRKQLAAGTLVSVLDAFLPPYDGFYLYYPSRAQLAPKLRVFADFLRARLNAPLQPVRASRSTTSR